jgi:hypothetical protein
MQYLYAFPNLRNRFLDTFADRQRTLLEHILAGKHIFAVDHPYPVNLNKLYKEINEDLTKQIQQFYE